MTTQQASGPSTLVRSTWQPYNSTLIDWIPAPHLNTPISTLSPAAYLTHISAISTLRPLAPYLNTLMSAISTSLPHSTHPTIRHTLPLDVVQLGLIGKHLHIHYFIFPD